jgi:hypothetical protein
MDLINVFEPISEGFYKAELKKKVSHEKRQRRIQYYEQQAKKQEL